jgi:antitoxin (DNA-binding transcriptional repressor) of toxin-antitoxin stability system
MGIRELRDTLTSTIRRVRAGETIEITHDGIPVALLSPIQQSPLERLIASGQVTLPKRPLLPLPTPVRATGPITASEALKQLRGD